MSFRDHSHRPFCPSHSHEPALAWRRGRRRGRGTWHLRTILLEPSDLQYECWSSFDHLDEPVVPKALAIDGNDHVIYEQFACGGAGDVDFDDDILPVDAKPRRPVEGLRDTSTSSVMYEVLFLLLLLSVIDDFFRS